MRTLIITLLLSTYSYLQAQIYIEKETPEITCGHSLEDKPSFIPAPEFLLRSNTGTQFEFQYVDSLPVPEAAKPAIEYAGKIWGAYIVSSLPIKVEVRWYDFGDLNNLATARSTGFIFAFDPENPAPFQANTWYPKSLGESLIEQHIGDENSPDIIVRINSAFLWYTKTDGNVLPGHYDLVSIMLHEIGHGLGFTSSARTETDNFGNTRGILRFGNFPMIYDTFLRTRDGARLVDTTRFENSSFELYRAFISEDINFRDISVIRANGGVPQQIYAPWFFTRGRSISHVDEYHELGDADAIMSPFLSIREAIHRPGPATLAMLEAMGWEVRYMPVVSNTNTTLVQKIQVFPNPASNQLQIQWPEDFPEQVVYQIADIAGRVVERGQVAKGQAISLNQFKSGYYNLTLQSKATIYFSKFSVR